jgi:hypothetical protein
MKKRGFDVSKIKTHTLKKKKGLTSDEKGGFGVSRIRNTPLKEKRV